jgi:hypothetical protein
MGSARDALVLDLSPSTTRLDYKYSGYEPRVEGVTVDPDTIGPASLRFLRNCLDDHTELAYAFTAVEAEEYFETVPQIVEAVRKLLTDLVEAGLIRPGKWGDGPGLNYSTGNSDELLRLVSMTLDELAGLPGLGHPMVFDATPAARAVVAEIDRRHLQGPGRS